MIDTLPRVEYAATERMVSVDNANCFPNRYHRVQLRAHSNGAVERIQTTCDKESVTNVPKLSRVGSLGIAFRQYEQVYNTVRPHQALDYQTPQEHLDETRRRTA